MPAPLAAALVAAAGFLASGPASADTYPRQPGVDVVHYAFRLTLADDTNEIEGEATVELAVRGDGPRVPHGRSSVPIAPWLFRLGVARFAVEHRPEWRGLPIDTRVYPQDRDPGFSVFAEPTTAALDFFSDRIGPYSYERQTQPGRPYRTSDRRFLVGAPRGMGVPAGREGVGGMEPGRAGGSPRSGCASIA